MKSGQNTLDKLIKYYEQSAIDTNNHNQKIYGINNFNNVETADRKLIINNKLEFWVQDKILNENCCYFKEKKEINNKNNIEKTINNINLNYNKNKEIKSQKRNFKMEIQIRNTKRNNFTKQNSKDLPSKIYKKIPNLNYNTISTEQNEKNFNNQTITKTKIKNKICIKALKLRRSFINKRRNNKIKLNKSCITEDLIKIQKLKEIIKKRKLALKTFDNSSTDRTFSKINNKNIFETIDNNSKTKNLRKNNIFGNNYNTNINNKKLYFNNIINNNLNLKENKINIKKRNNNNNNQINLTDENINKDINKNDSKSFIKITKIYINDKNEYELFFDVLLWMYTKDIKKLKKFSKNFETLLNILSLAKFLKIKKQFYISLLTQINNNNFDIKFFNSKNWARNKISFYALEKIIPLLEGNFIRIYSLISWLKPKNINCENFSSNKRIIEEIKKTKDFFLVRNYIKKYKLFYSLSKEEIIELKKIFIEFIDCFDMEAIFDNYIINSNKLFCSKYNEKLNSIYQISNLNEKNEENNYKSYKLFQTSKLLMNGQNTHKKIVSDINSKFYE